MERFLPNKIEAAMLYDNFDVMDQHVMLNLINEHVSSFGVKFEASKYSKPPFGLHLYGNRMTVEINYVDSPIPAEFFANTLGSAFTQRSFPQAQEAVQHHTGYLHVRISNGETAPPDPFIDEEPPEQPNFLPEGFDFAASLLKMILTINISKNQPLAVYWGQSDRLLGMRDYLQVALNNKDISLLVHPYSDSNDKAATIYTIGAQNIIGKEVVFNAGNLPASELEELALHFVSISKNTGLHIPDGDVFGRNETEQVRVSYDIDQNTGAQLVLLSCERSDAHGINDIVEEDPDADPAFDLEDPAERAMHERIEELKKLAQKQQADDLGTEDDLTRFEAELHDEGTEWTGVRNRVDVASLRTLAGKMASDDNNIAEEAPAKRNSRLGGLFTKK